MLLKIFIMKRAQEPICRLIRLGLRGHKLASCSSCRVVVNVIDKRRMPITEDEMNALRVLLREELQAEARPFRNEVNKRFDELAIQMDGLYRRDERREQEYLSIREQISRLEAGRA